MAQEIVLTSDGSQNFTIVLDAVTYSFNVSFNTRVGVWTANISREGVELANGITLVGGVDIVQQYTFILKNLFIVNLDNPKVDATEDSLGTDVKLFKLTDAEVASGG